MPPPEAAPHSSLSHMLGALGAKRFFWNNDAALAAACMAWKRPSRCSERRLLSCNCLMPQDESWRLPDGSVIVETGGFKGRTREVPRDELYGLFEIRLGVPAGRCHSEYGMCEMASQFYGFGLEPVKRGPHWVRTRAMDPETGDDARPGHAGLLRHCDLANFNSVLALQTQDSGTLTEDGFLLHGRAADADLRGCSLAVEELWAARLRALSQSDVVAALAEFARRWRDPADPFRRRAEALTAPFPFAMTRLSLDALLDSLTPEALWRLIDSEGVRDALRRPAHRPRHRGQHAPARLDQPPPCPAHAERVGGQTAVGGGGGVGEAVPCLPRRRLARPGVDNRTAGSGAGAKRSATESFARACDLVLAYGSDQTITALRALCPPGTPLLGYGHRVSFGLLMQGADEEAEAARGFATDVLLYDQGGCLSPQTIFVEGDRGRTQSFAARLADALAAAVPDYPLPHRAPHAAARVREARQLARMED